MGSLGNFHGIATASLASIYRIELVFRHNALKELRSDIINVSTDILGRVVVVVGALASNVLTRKYQQGEVRCRAQRQVASQSKAPIPLTFGLTFKVTSIRSLILYRNGSEDLRRSFGNTACEAQYNSGQRLGREIRAVQNLKTHSAP